MDYLSNQYLAVHGLALAEAGRSTRGEAGVRQYVQHALRDAEVEANDSTAFEESRFEPSLAQYGAVALVGLTLLSNLTGKKWAGALAGLLAAHSLYQVAGGRRPIFHNVLTNQQDASANLIVKLAPKNATRHRVVVLAHLDAARELRNVEKPLVRAGSTAGIVLSAVNGIAQLLGWEGLRQVSAWGLAATLPVLAAQRSEQLTEITDDNAAAIATLIGLTAQLHHEPLNQTEVWVAFVGAHQAGYSGLHALLDAHRVELAQAWFVTLNQLNAGRVVYGSGYTGESHLSAYQPDAESLKWAETLAQAHPDLGVTAAPIEGLDEVGALQARGFRAIGITTAADVVNIAKPAGTAAQFVHLMIQQLDERQY